MVCADHSTKVCRKNVGHCHRQWIQVDWPLRLVTGGDARVFLQLRRVDKAFALFTESHQQARGE